MAKQTAPNVPPIPFRRAAPSNPTADAMSRVISEMRRPEQITLTNLIRIKLRPMPAGAMERAATAIRKPEPPTVPDPDDPEKRMPNPNHPDYLEELARYHLEVIATANRIMIILATECESVPDGYYRPEDDGWVEVLTEAGVPLPTPCQACGLDRLAHDDAACEQPTYAGVQFRNPTERYRVWFETYAISNEMDYSLLLAAVASRMGTVEAHVADAVTFFRRRAAHDANPGDEAAGDDGNGDRVPSDTPVDGGTVRGA